jgi:hypothetical protein
LAERPLPVRILAYEAGSLLEGRWVLAQDLRAGDEVLLRSGEVVALESVRLDNREEQVYNFHVAELQNYAVGSCGVLVHNTNDKTVFQIAEEGGRHSGFLRERLGRTPAQLRREARTLRRRAAEHQAKIANREGYRNFNDPAIQKLADEGRTKHLQKEISNFEQQAEIVEALARRMEAGGP